MHRVYSGSTTGAQVMAIRRYQWEKERWNQSSHALPLFRGWNARAHPNTTSVLHEKLDLNRLKCAGPAALSGLHPPLTLAFLHYPYRVPLICCHPPCSQSRIWSFPAAAKLHVFSTACLISPPNKSPFITRSVLLFFPPPQTCNIAVPLISLEGPVCTDLTVK